MERIAMSQEERDWLGVAEAGAGRCRDTAAGRGEPRIRMLLFNSCPLADSGKKSLPLLKRSMDRGRFPKNPSVRSSPTLNPWTSAVRPRPGLELAPWSCRTD